MAQVFKTTKYSNYLGEYRPLLDIVVNFDGPYPTPSVTPSISMTPSVTPSISVTPSVTPSIGSSQTPTPTITSTLTPTPTITSTLTPTPTPSSTPPQPQPESFTLSGDGLYTAYNGTYKLTQPFGKRIRIRYLIPKPVTTILELGDQGVFYNVDDVTKWVVQNTFVPRFFTATNSRWATTYPINVGIAETSSTVFFQYTANLINGIYWPTEGTQTYNGITWTITYNYLS
jgi:hypothetical protein